MQKVLSTDLWKIVQAQARNARQRKAAIAYVTKDLLGFRKEDILLVDASKRAISSGETDASLLHSLYKKGVHLYSCESLHAKVILLDDVAIIGSGNMSSSSATALVEAGLLTDHSSTVAGVASLIEQLLRQSIKLQSEDIAALCKIKVVRRGRQAQEAPKQKKPKITTLGNRTWLVGVQEYIEHVPPEEQKLIDQAIKRIRLKMGDPNEAPNWIRFTGKSRFVQECREGDSIIQIWRSSRAKRPSVVLRVAPILLKQSAGKWIRIYIREPIGTYAKMPWGKFQHLLKKVGHPKSVTANSEQQLDPEIADAIARSWIATIKS